MASTDPNKNADIAKGSDANSSLSYEGSNFVWNSGKEKWEYGVAVTVESTKPTAAERLSNEVAYFNKHPRQYPRTDLFYATAKGFVIGYIKSATMGLVDLRPERNSIANVLEYDIATGTNEAIDIAGTFLAFKGGRGSKAGKNESFKTTEKMGKAKGEMSGNSAVANKQVKDLVNQYKLNRAEQRELHDYISKKGYGYKRIEEIIQTGEYKK